MDKESTEIQKASGYLKMLKQEGKLDESAIPELLKMYDISHKEAIALLESFKQTDDYKNIVARIIKEQMFTVVCYAIIGGFFLLAGFVDPGSPNPFAFHGLLYVLAAFGLINYIVKLLQERFRNSKRFAWISNKALPYVITLGILLVYLQYQFLNQSYLINTRNGEVRRDLVLNSDCIESRTGGKHPTYYYEFSVEYYDYPFRWYESAHYYAFHKNLWPNVELHKGDTIIAFINEIGYGSDYITISNVAKNGQPFLDLKKRNELAKDKAFQNCILIAFVFIIAMVVLIGIEVNRKLQFKKW